MVGVADEEDVLGSLAGVSESGRVAGGQRRTGYPVQVVVVPPGRVPPQLVDVRIDAPIQDMLGRIGYAGCGVERVSPYACARAPVSAVRSSTCQPVGFHQTS